MFEHPLEERCHEFAKRVFFCVFGGGRRRRWRRARKRGCSARKESKILKHDHLFTHLFSLRRSDFQSTGGGVLPLGHHRWLVLFTKRKKNEEKGTCKKKNKINQRFLAKFCVLPRKKQTGENHARPNIRLSIWREQSVEIEIDPNAGRADDLCTTVHEIVATNATPHCHPMIFGTAEILVCFFQCGNHSLS